MKTLEHVKKYLPVGTLGVSLMLHLLIFFCISGVILIQAVAPKQPFSPGEPVAPADTVQPPDLPDDTPLAPENLTEPANDPAPANTAAFEPETISSNVVTAMPAFTVAAPTGISSGVSGGAPSVSTRSNEGIKNISRVGNPFGSTDPNVKGLKGYFYDLKQTKSRQSSHLSSEQYWVILGEFFGKGWNEQVLSRYFRVNNPLYTTQIFIPTMLASEAPKAFNVEKIVQPAQWVIVYRGKVSPPEDGAYRFVGYADDVIAVAVNGKTVLINARDRGDALMKGSGWKQDPQRHPGGVWAGNGRLLSGDWVEMEAAKTYDLDVLIGERPGGQFNAFLLVEKQGAQYEKAKEGLLLPIFQLAPDSPETNPKLTPQIARGGRMWKLHEPAN